MTTHTHTPQPPLYTHTHTHTHTHTRARARSRNTYDSPVTKRLRNREAQLMDGSGPLCGMGAGPHEQQARVLQSVGEARRRGHHRGYAAAVDVDAVPTPQLSEPVHRLRPQTHPHAREKGVSKCANKANKRSSASPESLPFATTSGPT